MLQVKTIKRTLNPWWKQLISSTYIKLEDYEKEVNEFCKTVKVVSIIPTLINGRVIQYTIVYDDGVIQK